jgi:hypothetical protein
MKRAVFIPTVPIFPGYHNFPGTVKFFRGAAEDAELILILKVHIKRKTLLGLSLNVGN